MTAFLGGISENYNSNLIVNGTEVTAVEADEFDRSFLTLSPDYACITSMDADHLDIYGDASELKKSFKDFTGRAGGHTPTPLYIHNHIHFGRLWSVNQLARQL